VTLVIVEKPQPDWRNGYHP